MWRLSLSHAAVEHFPLAKPIGAVSVSYPPHENLPDYRVTERKKSSYHLWFDTEQEARAEAQRRLEYLIENAAHRLQLLPKLIVRTDKDLLAVAQLPAAHRALLQAAAKVELAVEARRAKESRP